MARYFVCNFTGTLWNSTQNPTSYYIKRQSPLRLPEIRIVEFILYKVPIKPHGNYFAHFLNIIELNMPDLVVVVVVVLLFPANNTAMERYNRIQNKLLEATREAIRLIGLVALIMTHKVNKCMWLTGVRGRGRGMHHGAKRTCRFRGVGSVLIIIKQDFRDWLGLHDRLLRHSLIFFQVILS